MKTSIKTERLYIRNFEIKDAEGLFAYLSQPRVNCFMDEQLHTLQEAVADIEHRSKDDLQYAVCLKKEDSIIGNVFAMKEEPVQSPYPVPIKLRVFPQLLCGYSLPIVLQKETAAVPQGHCGDGDGYTDFASQQ